MDLKTLIKDYLEKAKLMQVVTSKNNQPWACSVYFAYDENFNLFWISRPDRRHSQEIEANEKVAGTIVLPHTPGDKVRGLQFEGVAKRVTDPSEMQHAMDVYAGRMGSSEQKKQAILNGTNPHAPYQIIPTRIVLFDELNFPDNPQQEYLLK